MKYFFLITELTGTIAFAISGSLTAIKKEMDLLGVMILGMTTAVGGGILRDMILGIFPPKAFIDGIYVFVSLLISALCFFIIFLQHKKILKVRNSQKQKNIFHNIIIIADAIGLGIFTVAGVKAVFDAELNLNYFIPVFLGTLTGVGGGIFRDVMAGDRPYIFVKHIYACASILGALVCALLWNSAGQSLSMILGFFTVLVFRILAIHFEWNLPHA